MTYPAPPRGPGRPPRETPRRNVVIRFEPAELALIDAARGDQDRQSFVAQAAIARAANV